MELDFQVTGLPCGSAGKESVCNMGDLSSIPGSGRSLEKVFFPVKFHGQRGLRGYKSMGSQRVGHD